MLDRNFVKRLPFLTLLFAVPICGLPGSRATCWGLNHQTRQNGDFQFAIWLIPSEPQRSSLEREMWRVADRNDLPRFRPHVTLVASAGGTGLPDLKRSLEGLLDEVDGFAASHGPVRMTAKDRNVNHWDETHDWSVSVYVPFQMESTAATLFRDAESTFPRLRARRDNGEYMPHLSLAYVEPPGQRKVIASQFDGKVPPALDFDTIAVAMPRSGEWHDIFNQRTGDSGDKAQWMVLYTRPLGQAAMTKAVTSLSIVLVGGQLGTDQGAYRAAEQSGLLAFGWMPPFRETNRESGTPKIPEDILLRETASRNSPRTADIPRSARTALNARDAEGVLIVGQYGQADAGTVATVAYAHDYGKTIHYADPSAKNHQAEIDGIIEWLQSNHISVLDVAGPSHPNPCEFLLEIFRKATSGRRDTENFGDQ